MSHLDSVDQKPWIVIKLGGSSLQEDNIVRQIAKDVKKLSDLDYKLLIIHGGGPAINEALSEKKITWEFIEGQRKTTSEMMIVIENTLVGTVNRKIQKIFSQEGIPVVGLSGSDLEMLLCEPQNESLGLVGLVKKVSSEVIKVLVQGSKLRVIPLVAPIGVDEKGERYNINADMAAMNLAVDLKAQHLVYMTDQPGIWDQNKQLIKEIESLALYQLTETHVVQGGMLVKVRAVIQALRNNVQEVDIIDARTEGNLFSLVHENKSVGTRCYRN
ncbi:MAG: acetylglutamate kinase [Bdellovibrionaceae bacterium]|nr:acetylglutamate kinase [Pseudobdellovibrionaceae bacterium]